MKTEALDKITSNTASKAVYDALLKELDKLGSYEIEAKKTSLHITNGRAFLGVHPRSNGILLNIVTSKKLESPRIKKTEQVSANRYHNEILLVSATELDTELNTWLNQAYAS